jgi:hypothetical protein
MARLRDVLSEWLNEQIKVVNPQSYIQTALKDSLTMETYQAEISEVGEDYVRLKYWASRKNEPQPVDQVVPFEDIKRISVWGEERILHL